MDFTTVVAVDSEHVEELRVVWPLWRRHKPELLKAPLLLMCDEAISRRSWDSELAFLDHPDRRVEIWSMSGVPQREKMLSSLVYGPSRFVETEWYLKIDTDVVAREHQEWLRPEWFEPDQHRPQPVFVTNPWGYTKPADAIDRLDDWAVNIPALNQFPPLEIPPHPGWSLVRHPRIISWLFFGQTSWTREMAALTTGRLPVASQDTFLWYCAARCGDYFRTVSMSDFGWSHVHSIRKLRRVASHVMRSTDQHTSNGSGRPEGSHNGSARHASVLASLVSRLVDPVQCGVEVGVLRGETAHLLLRELPALKLYLVDRWAPPSPNSDYARSGDSVARLTAAQHEQNYQQTIFATRFAGGRAVLLRTESNTAATGDDVPGHLSFVFLDADPSFSEMSRALRDWWPKVRPGGILCGHDYGHPKDRRGRWGVSRAVEEFAGEQDISVNVEDATVWWIAKPGSGESTAVIPEQRRTVRRTGNRVGELHRGVMFVLTGPAHGVRMVASLWSLRRHFGGQVTVFTTQARSHEIGRRCAADPRLGVQHRIGEQFAASRNSDFLTKLNLLSHSPYATTAYLDCDTVVAGSIAELFEAAEDDEFCATRFADWTTRNGVVRKRIEQWYGVGRDEQDVQRTESLVRAALAEQPAVNGGVFAFRSGATILEPWRSLAITGQHTFICDEIALQLLLPQHRHRLLDNRFNCSPKFGVDRPYARIWHFHGEQHVRRAESRALWLPVFDECVRENVAGLQDWAPAGDQRLAGYLRTPEAREPRSTQGVAKQELTFADCGADQTRIAFTTNWHVRHEPLWREQLAMLRDQPLRCLEIGSYEGRSAVWLIQNVLTHPSSTLTCVDPWPDREVERRFDDNIAEARFTTRVHKLKTLSSQGLRTLSPPFDFIYIDGSHEGRHVLEDAVLAFRLLAVGGLLIFDDYSWKGRGRVDHPPQPAIDAFLTLWSGCLRILHKGAQVCIQKSAEGEEVFRVAVRDRHIRLK